MCLGRGCGSTPIIQSNSAGRMGTGRVWRAPIGGMPVCSPGAPCLRFPSFDVLPFPAAAADRVCGAISRAMRTVIVTGESASHRGPSGQRGPKASPRGALIAHEALARGPPARK